jgi:hypothetical protein
MSGWLKIHRCITNHWLYTENRVFSKYEAWLDILMTVNYLDAKVLIKGKLYHVKRGQSILSMESWAKRWNWDKSKVRRFMELLQNDAMIVLKTDNTTTHLTVCKYESYQYERHADKTQTKRRRNADEYQTTPIEEEEEELRKKEEKEKMFERFWDLFDNKVDRFNSEKKFMKLDLPVIEKIIDVVPLYTSTTTTDKKNPKGLTFRKNPLTWLNGECWNDEIIGASNLPEIPDGKYLNSKGELRDKKIA